MPVGDYPTYAEEAAARDRQVEAARMRAAVDKSRWRQLLDGDITVEDLDDDELMRGQVRNRDGNFAGSPPKMIPKKMHDQLVRRIISRGAEKIRADFFDAIDVIGSVARDVNVDPAIRLKAAGMIIDRVAGRTPEKVELSLEVKPWEQAMDRIIKVIPTEEAPTTAADVIDAEVVE